MRLRDLKRLREQGKRPAAGLVLVRDRNTQSEDAEAARAELIVEPLDARQDWRPVAGLSVHVRLSAWAPWVVELLQAMQRAKPAAIGLTDPASLQWISVYDGEPLPIACRHDPIEAYLDAQIGTARRELAESLAERIVSGEISREEAKATLRMFDERSAA